MNHARIMSEFTWVNCYDFRSIVPLTIQNKRGILLTILDIHTKDD